MKTIKKETIMPGIWQCTEQFPKFSNRDAQECISAIGSSPTLRSRVCMHPNIADRMQEMFIAFDGSSYVRPSFHLNMDESFHMIEGYGKYLFFDEQGHFTHDVRLGPYTSDLPFYCRIPGNQPHSLILLSQYALAHEVMTGPFLKSNTIFPDWAPDYKTKRETEAYRNHYALQPVSPLLGCQYDRVTEEMCRAKSGVVALRRADLEYLKTEVHKTSRKRIRLCTHQNDSSLLHEMFVIYTDATYVRPNLHIGKDESLHILEGEADFVFFDNAGQVIEVVQLGDRTTDKNFFVRVPQNVYHTIIMRSSHLVIHEATVGPFNRQETLWASWAPESDPKEISQFQEQLEMQINGCLLASTNQ